MCFAIGSQHLGCRVPTVPTKTRLESNFCNKKSFTPISFMIAFCQANADGTVTLKQGGQSITP